MQGVLRNVSDKRVKATIIWLPMFPGDSRRWAVKRTKEFADKRLTYFWDEDRITGKKWQHTLDIGATAWDIYFLYRTDAKWHDSPTLPDFWMHQLGGVRKAPRLDARKFERELRKLLEQLD